MKFRAGKLEWIERLRNQTVIAADVGASSKRRTFGLAWQERGEKPEKTSVTFGVAVKMIYDLILKHRKVVLILEAPLSGLSMNQCPAHRSFEIDPPRIPGKSISDYRGWYYGAGATTALSAMILLQRLQALDTNLHQHQATIVLYEGFVSFKRSRQSDVDDAVALLGCFLRKFSCRKPPFSPSIKSADHFESISFLEMIGISDKEEIPAVIHIERKKSSAKR